MVYDIIIFKPQYSYTSLNNCLRIQLWGQPNMNIKVLIPFWCNHLDFVALLFARLISGSSLHHCLPGPFKRSFLLLGDLLFKRHDPPKSLIPLFHPLYRLCFLFIFFLMRYLKTAVKLKFKVVGLGNLRVSLE